MSAGHTQRAIGDRVLTFADLSATLVLAVESALIAVRADLDLFGILVLAFVGATGGGVLRDLILGDHPPAALRDWRYAALAVTAAAVVIVAGLVTGHVGRWSPPMALNLLEAIGLALAVVAGSEKSIDFGLNAAGVAIIAVVNGCGGGIVRDILTAQIPRVLHADFYATIALCGGLMFALLNRHTSVGKTGVSIITGTAIFTVRIMAIVGSWGLPHMQ